jgi:hypothetical protein
VRRLALLMIVAAASATTGCVTVPRQDPGPASSAGPGPGAAARPAGPAASPSVVPLAPQPDHEVLATTHPEADERAGSPEAAGTTLAHRPASGSARSAAPVPRVRVKEPQAEAPVRPARPERRDRTTDRPERPARPRPPLHGPGGGHFGPGGVPARTGRVGGADVCALGRTFGRWPANSDAARICDQYYGHGH